MVAGYLDSLGVTRRVEERNAHQAREGYAEVPCRFDQAILRRGYGDEIGDLKAMRVLDFCIKEIGPSIYNQAIADAQSYFQEKASDLGGARYEAEFDFWKK